MKGKDFIEDEEPMAYYKKMPRMMDFINAAHKFFEDANEQTCKLWSSPPPISSIIQGVLKVKSLGYNKIFYTCTFENPHMILKLETDFGVDIYDQSRLITLAIRTSDDESFAIFNRRVI